MTGQHWVFEHERRGAMHTRVAVRCGEREAHRALLGELTMLNEEWAQLRRMIQQGRQMIISPRDAHLLTVEFREREDPGPEPAKVDVPDDEWIEFLRDGDPQ